MIKTLKRAACCAAVALVAFAGVPALNSAQAEDPIATALDASALEGYLGKWLLSLEIDLLGQTLDLFLDFADVSGKAGATLDSANQAEPLAISEILENDEGGLDLNSELTFGGSIKIDIMMKLKLEDGLLVGSIKDKGGIFSADIKGTRPTQEQLESVQGRRPAPTEARLNIGGKRVRVTFAGLRQGTSDWDLFQDVADGEIFKFTLSRATKIYTDFDLNFGDVVLEKENMGPDYPGVYSLWLKKVGNGWNLVFNSKSDIWGTRYEPEFDVAEVPLTVSRINGDPEEVFLVKLEGAEGGGTLQIFWGDTQWSAPFSVSQ